jgi:hypothetical protein
LPLHHLPRQTSCTDLAVAVDEIASSIKAG